jgi:serine/threonine-protein kinase RsbW
VPAVELAPAVHSLPAELDSIGQARRIATSVGRPLMANRQLEALELAVSEIVANAIRHSGSRDAVRLEVTPRSDHVCVRVTDGGAGLVPRPGAMASEKGAGYGLFIVERLTRRWGMTREHGGTRVWFELDYSAPHASPA